jgi:hypothetical protein
LFRGGGVGTNKARAFIGTTKWNGPRKIVEIEGGSRELDAADSRSIETIAGLWKNALYGHKLGNDLKNEQAATTIYHMSRLVILHCPPSGVLDLCNLALQLGGLLPCLDFPTLDVSREEK